MDILMRPPLPLPCEQVLDEMADVYAFLGSQLGAKFGAAEAAVDKAEGVM